MLKKQQQVKNNEQFQQELDNAIQLFHDAYPDIYQFSSDRQVASCLLLMLKKYEKIFLESKPEKREDIIKSVDIFTKFVAPRNSFSSLSQNRT